MNPRYPLLLEINTRVWLAELSGVLGRPASLDDIPDSELQRFANLGFNWIWMLSVWETSPASRQVSRSNPEWRIEFIETLRDLRDEDIGGSGFAISDYSVSPLLGGDAALRRLRCRLRELGLRLMLDFVPNHTGLDHQYVTAHPEYFIKGVDADVDQFPANYTRINSAGVDVILAHGRDPYFPGWPDTLQLDYSNPNTQDAMIENLLKIAGQCDGVRCDMAMLILPEVFERTWGRRPESFWPRATQRVRERVPDFCFMAEVYWDLEWTMQRQGFDYAYDKRLYDRLRQASARALRDHLSAGLDYQDKLARFLENHDEPRAAATFATNVHEAAAVITFLSPGLRFFHQGQLEGKKKRISPHLIRGPLEVTDAGLKQFYQRLLGVLQLEVAQKGDWQLLQCFPAWDGNPTSANVLVFSWDGPRYERLLVTVNYADSRSQCYVRPLFKQLAGRSIRLKDLMSTIHYDRSGDDLLSRGLYLDLPAWGYHVFEIKASSA